MTPKMDCELCVFRLPVPDSSNIIGSMRKQTLLYFVLKGKQFRCQTECKDSERKTKSKRLNTNSNVHSN
jgi:hypothetical protein